MSERVHYLDRLGRPITDPEAVESRRLLGLLRQLSDLAWEDDHSRKWDECVTAGELAEVAGVSVDVVLEWADGNHAYLVDHTATDGPRETWWVWQDGE